LKKKAALTETSITDRKQDGRNKERETGPPLHPHRVQHPQKWKIGEREMVSKPASFWKSFRGGWTKKASPDLSPNLP